MRTMPGSGVSGGISSDDWRNRVLYIYSGDEEEEEEEDGNNGAGEEGEEGEIGGAGEEGPRPQ